MQDSRDLATYIKRIAVGAYKAGKPTTIIFGTVISEKPLKIFTEQKMELGTEQLILSRNVTDFQTKISFDNPSIQQPISVDDNIEVNKIIINGGAPQEAKLYKNGNDGITGKLRNVKKVKHEITIYNALKEGEKVLLIEEQGGQRFVIIDRVVGI